MKKLPELKAGMIVECFDGEERYYIMVVPTPFHPHGGYPLKVEDGKLMINGCYASIDPDEIVAIYQAEDSLFEADGLVDIVSGELRIGNRYRIWCNGKDTIDPSLVDPGVVVQATPTDDLGETLYGYEFYLLVVEDTEEGAYGYEVVGDCLCGRRLAKYGEITKLWRKHASGCSSDERWPSIPEIHKMIEGTAPDWEN